MGRGAVVTGSSSGIGLEAARQLCGLGAHVVVSGPSQTRTERAAASVRAGSTGPGRATALPLDLVDFAGVRDFAAAVREALPGGLHLLLLNAGTQYWGYLGMADPGRAMRLPGEAFVAPSGHDRVYAVNHLGHFLLALLLAPSLAPDASVVVVSSTHAWWGAYERLTPAARPRYEERRDLAQAAYADSKLANVCFARALRRRLASAGAGSVSIHVPGNVMTTIGEAWRNRSLDAPEDARAEGEATRAMDAMLEAFAHGRFGLGFGFMPTERAGRLLLESAFLTSRADVVYAYSYPKELLRWISPESWRPWRERWSWYLNLPVELPDLLFARGLHASIGPECSERVQRRLWDWSLNATGISDAEAEALL